MTGAFVVVGPQRHGVVAHALGLAAASGSLADRLVRVTSEPRDVGQRLAEATSGHSGLMLHITDHLLADGAAGAADVVEGLAARSPLAVCLHDLPQPHEGEDRCTRRRAAYRRIACAATRLVVSSEFERSLLRACSPTPHEADEVGAKVVVVPLPVERDPGLASPRPSGGSNGWLDVGVLGFVYPGKGLEQVIEAAAAVRRLGHDVRVTNYGGVSAGHEDLAAGLAALASELRVPFRVTGFLSRGGLVGLLRATDVPVAAHRHVSASGSIATWVAVGRRPVVVPGPWVAELAARLPGSVTVSESLADSLIRAIADPASTWLAPGVQLGPTWAQAALAHEHVLDSVA